MPKPTTAHEGGPEIRRAALLALHRASARIHGRVLGAIWARELQALGVTLGHDTRIMGRPVVDIAPDSAITIHARTVLVSRPPSTALGTSRPMVLRTVHPGASIEIGEDCGLSGTAICSAQRVQLAKRVLVGADVIIADTDFHPVDVIPRRFSPIPIPMAQDQISIEDDVFIGARAIVLRGVTIGRGSVIGAGSVVTSDIPPFVVAAGNPCRPIRTIDQ